jgi:hypothetical protein
VARSVEETIRRYYAGIAARDLPAMRSAFPAMPANWPATFQTAVELTARVVSIGTITISGDEAQVQYTFNQRMRLQGGTVSDVTPTVSATLRRGPSGWQIQRIGTP